MSLYKDFYEPEPPQVYGDPKNRIWITKTGVRMQVDKMTTEHINRLLKLGFYPPNDEWEVIFRDELKRRNKD